jgi:hypothetical protein
MEAEENYIYNLKVYSGRGCIESSKQFFVFLLTHCSEKTIRKQENRF